MIEPGGATYDAATYPLADAPLERLYLRADGRLDPEPPGTDEPSDGGDAMVQENQEDAEH